MIRHTERGGHRYVDLWPSFAIEQQSEAEQAVRDEWASIARARLEERFGPCSDIAQMLGLEDAA